MIKRILYAVEDFPVTSETYIQTEIDYFLRQGIEIAVWSRRLDEARQRSNVPVFSGPLAPVVKYVNPGAIHAHWLPIAPSVLVENPGVPVTIRAHSFEFSPRTIRTYAADQRVAAIFLFPHLVKETFGEEPSGKVIPLPCAFDERLFFPHPKRRNTVVRATAGIGTKDIDSFLDVAKLVPEARFTLIISKPKEDWSYLTNLLGRNASMGFPVEIMVEVPREDAAKIVGSSEVCFRSNNPTGHPFGMPISIAEAMACETVPVVRDHAPARAYVGDAGLYFGAVQDAADRIRTVLSDEALKERLKLASAERAKRFRASVVLPKILETWSKACNW